LPSDLKRKLDTSLSAAITAAITRYQEADPDEFPLRQGQNIVVERQHIKRHLLDIGPWFTKNTQPNISRPDEAEPSSAHNIVAFKYPNDEQSNPSQVDSL
tara:strand:- start:17 stop:316 length:300 start_codon:yes stop_codon:yes gene_type:complete